MTPFLRAATALVLMAPCACASVTVPMPGFAKDDAAAAPLREHTALREAADRLGATVPAAANVSEKGGLRSVVFGGRGDAEREAAEAYLASLGLSADADLVFAEAEAVLDAAGEVAAAGLIGSGQAASDTDLALLEQSITDIQRCRRLMTTALKTLRDDGAPLTKSEIRELGDRFVAAARQVGTAADLAAARVDGEAPVYADRPIGGGVDAGY